MRMPAAVYREAHSFAIYNTDAVHNPIRLQSHFKMELAVQIVGFVDNEPQPGIVACEFVDAEGRRHTFIDKVPMFSAEALDAHSAYLQAGSISCEALARWQDAIGRNLVRITIGVLGSIETTEGVSEFVVLSAQLS